VEIWLRACKRCKWFYKEYNSSNNIPAAAKTQMLAEAKFLRAYGDSQLLLYYGQYNDPSVNTDYFKRYFCNNR